MNTMADCEREKFEAWAYSEFLTLHRHDSGQYSYERTHSAWRAWQAALAASQPVGQEPVAWKYQEKAADGVWEDRIGERLPCWEHRNLTPLYAVPPAQTLGLGRFRKAVEAWKRDAQNKHRAGEIFPEQKDAIWKEADRLLALIDSKAVGNK